MHRIDGTMAETRDNNVSRDDLLRALDASFGAWADRDFDGASYVGPTEVLAGMRASEESITRLLFRGLEWIEVALRRGGAWRLTRPQPDV